jgi:Cu/Ag efflux protein CusF
MGVLALTLIATVGVALARQPERQEYTLRGEVRRVYLETGRLTVKHERVAGWREAMTMTFGVDNAEITKRLKRGDTILATVYHDDARLYNVRLAPLPRKRVP